MTFLCFRRRRRWCGTRCQTECLRGLPAGVATISQRCLQRRAATHGASQQRARIVERCARDETGTVGRGCHIATGLADELCCGHPTGTDQQ